MDRTPPGESLPPSQDDIDISRADLETAADAAGHFRPRSGSYPNRETGHPFWFKGDPHRIAFLSRAPRTWTKNGLPLDPITALGASRHALRSPTALRLPRQAPLRRGI